MRVTYQRGIIGGEEVLELHLFVEKADFAKEKEEDLAAKAGKAIEATLWKVLIDAKRRSRLEEEEA